MSQRRYPEAAAGAQAMTQRCPHHDLGWRMLAEALELTGQPMAALAALRRAVALSPDDTRLHCCLGSSLQTIGRFDEAEMSYRRALRLAPDLVEVHHNRGGVLRALGRLAEAEASYRRAVELRPGAAASHNDLGNLLQTLGRLGEAEASYGRALQLEPELAEAHNNLGNLLQTLGRLGEAEASYRRALQIEPGLTDAHNNLGNVLQALDRLTEAEASYRRALQLKPDFADAHGNLGNVLKALGRLVESEASYRRALQLDPQNAQAFSNLLFRLLYQADQAEEAIFEAHRGYDARFGTHDPHKRPAQRSRPRDPSRRLKVGYVSPDLRQHSVAYFISPVLREHNRETIEVFCYANVPQPDTVTSRLRGFAEHWLDTVRLTDAQLADRIAADGIDILVDLAGHTAGNRLPVFARRAAPVQVSWLGYPNTTGLSAMDYRLVDAVTDPPGEADRWASETLIRLEGGFLCFEPAADAPPTEKVPYGADGAITFGCFNNPSKLSSTTLAVWSRLLDLVPASRLLLKGTGLGEPATREGLLTRFAQQGGDPQRLVLLGVAESVAEHLTAYRQVDIALDPFPYNGTTTTCEALWMGVPTVTLLGNRHAGRVGASLLNQVGLPELVASSPQGYVDIAAALAADQCGLSTLRHTLRERMRTSSLCDARSFTRQIEATYRTLADGAHTRIVSGASPRA